ncbi:hypothetical protein HCA69_10765 [Listeria grandensis]|uniref:Bacterial Ig domain-containing protein n=1 Tax=Listeria grandensis TaxID=1494963 RepID=A0A7X1CQB5_9LIST|nr:Ig-like domain-containing protein [Listeria grandensis]MBC1936851.1 hypothetical protein [Listeria grandensis]
MNLKNKIILTTVLSGALIYSSENLYDASKAEAAVSTQIAVGNWSTQTVVPYPTVVGAITSNTTIINGRGIPGAVVYATPFFAHTSLSSAIVDPHGNFQLLIPKQQAHSQLDFKQVVNGVASSTISYKVGLGIGAVSKVDTVRVTDTKVTGKGVAGATVSIKSGHHWGIEIGTGVVDSHGNFHVTIPKQSAGIELYVSQIRNGDESSSVKSVVETSPILLAPTITTHYAGALSLHGSASEGSTKVILKINGINIRTVNVAADNSYQFDVTDIPALAVSGTVFEVIAQDASGQLSPATSSTVKEAPAPTVNDYTFGETHVTGTAALGMAKVSVYDKDGKWLRDGSIDADGKFNVLVSDLSAFKFIGDSFSVRVSTTTGATSKATEGTIKNDLLTAVAAPTIANFYLNDTIISGTVTDGAKKVFLKINNQVIREGKIASDGSYLIATDDLTALKLIGVSFEVVTQDENNRYSETARATVKAFPAPVVTTYRAGQAYINGTLVLPAEVTRISAYDKSGTLLRNGAVNENGTFRIYVSGVAALQIAGDSFTVKAFGKYNRISETTVTIQP